MFFNLLGRRGRTHMLDRRVLRLVDLGVVGGIALGLRLAMAWAIPLASGSADPNCAPDESVHFLFTSALSHGRAPTWPDQTDSIYGAFLPTPYVVQALTLALAGDVADVGRFQPVSPWARGYEAARLGSALLGTLTALALAMAAGVWTGNRGATVAVGLTAALYPQLVFVGAYTNADAFSVCAGALLVLAVARWAREGEGAVGLAAMGAAGGLVVLGKMSGYFLLPVTAPWIAWAIWRRRMEARALLPAIGAFALVSGPVLAWNAFRNGGDVLGLQRYNRFLAEVWHGKDGRQIPEALRWFVSALSRSSFGVFKNMNLDMPVVFYAAAAVLLAIGVTAGMALLPRATGTTRRAAVWLGAVISANLLLVVYNCWFVDFSPQGRYMLLSALLLAGLTVWTPTAWLPPRTRWCWPSACIGFLLAAAVQAQVLVYKYPCLPSG
jgi:4-amino-4-deoxy-L-arabinose transferase-like glycosyltransferase